MFLALNYVRPPCITLAYYSPPLVVTAAVKLLFKNAVDVVSQFKVNDAGETFEEERAPGDVLSVHLMNGHSMQTGVCTDHCNYGALGESSFLCRFICHINKGISSTYGG